MGLHQCKNYGTLVESFDSCENRLRFRKLCDSLAAMSLTGYFEELSHETLLALPSWSSLLGVSSLFVWG